MCGLSMLLVFIGVFETYIRRKAHGVCVKKNNQSIDRCLVPGWWGGCSALFASFEA